jgi:hypothetical protein
VPIDDADFRRADEVEFDDKLAELVEFPVRISLT